MVVSILYLLQPQISECTWTLSQSSTNSSANLLSKYRPRTFVVGWSVPKIQVHLEAAMGGLYYGMHNTPFCTGMGTEHTQDRRKQCHSRVATHMHSHILCQCFTCWHTTSPKAQGGEASSGLAVRPCPTQGEGVNGAAAEPGFSFGHAFCCPIG